MIRISFAFTLLLVSQAYGQTTIRVPLDAPTIQIAISNAMPFDTIIVDPGTYFEAISFGGKVITLQSTNPNDPAVVAATIIDAGGLGSVVTFSGSENANTILDGFTITGGIVGIDGNGSLAAINRCVVSNNKSYGLNDCDGIIQRCLIQNNRISGIRDCDGTIVDTVIENTRVSPGYGVSSSSADIIRCTIRNNNSVGIYRHSGNISQSSITGNTGAGIDGGVTHDTGLVENCVIAGNGGSGLERSNKTVLSCTITGNNKFGFSEHTGTISHVILWDNNMGALNFSTTPIFSSAANPLFVQPGFFDSLTGIWVDGDYHLTPNSPLIDLGDPQYLSDSTAPIEDFDGNPRVVGARIDIGAFEFQSLPECTGADFDGDGTPDMCDPDIDNDGTGNAVDPCDFTPQGIPVNAEGRPLADQNSDCVVDLRDFAEFQRSLFGPTP